MIEDAPELIRETFGTSGAAELRVVLKELFQVRWKVPHVRFSNIMVEHFLFFLARNRTLVATDEFREVVRSKLLEEYGYEASPAVLPHLLDDLVAELIGYFADNPEMRAPARGLLATQDTGLALARELHAAGVPITSREKESIQQLTGLPVSYLRGKLLGGGSGLE